MDKTSRQFFLPGLYAIKVVAVAYFLLTYNIAFLKIIFNAFHRSRFLKHVLSDVTKVQSYVQIVRDL